MKLKCIYISVRQATSGGATGVGEEWGILPKKKKKKKNRAPQKDQMY